jgi:lipid-binding SYLF domain-containing protein
MWMDKRWRWHAVPVLATCLLAAGPALAASSYGANQNTGSAVAATADNSGTQGLVNRAVGVVTQMQKDPQLAQLMQKAKGIYIVPNYGRGALGIGGQGGSGVMLSHQDGSWTGPAFYDLGGISIGLQAGGSAGPMAFLLMSDKAVNEFKTNNSFSFGAGAGLTIVNYSAHKEASWGKGDIIAWSQAKGAYAGASIGVTDIHWDGGKNHQYYNKKVTPPEVLQGQVTNASAEPLKNALAA